MKSVFSPSEYQDIRDRIEKMSQDSIRKWGKMEPAQMLAHCNIGLKQGLGLLPVADKSNFILRSLVKKIVLNAIKKGDIGRNRSTFPQFLVKEPRDFELEKQALLANLAAYFAKGAQSEIGRHPYFGKMSNEEWGILHYGHLDHHLGQFSV